MITTTDKIRIFKQVLPFGFMYENDEHRSKIFFENNYSYYLPTDLRQHFETENDFITAIEILVKTNINNFIYKAVRLNKIDFLDFLEEQFYLSKNKNENCVSYWLGSIHHHIMLENGLFTLQEELNEKRGVFLKWYNTIIKTIPVGAISKENRLTIKQIALKIVYENGSVTRENSNEIIQKFGWSSGEKLYQEFNFYYQRINRTGYNDDTIKILKNRIKLLESVIDLVPTEKKQQVIDECKLLKVHLL